MTDDERALTRKVYQLHLEQLQALFRAHGEEIAALRKANEALQRSHAIIGELLQLAAAKREEEER